mgnify:CR=1 FL=1
MNEFPNNYHHFPEVYIDFISQFLFVCYEMKPKKNNFFSIQNIHCSVVYRMMNNKKNVSIIKNIVVVIFCKLF